MAMSIATTSWADPPRVALEISDAPVDSASLSVLRTAAGFVQPVIQARGALVGTEALVTDWAAAVGRPLSYTVTALDASGTVLEQATITVAALPDTPESFVWLSDPLDESTPRLVYAVGDTGRTVSKVATIALAYPLGADLPTASAGKRRGLGSFPLTIRANGPDEQAAVDDIVANAPAVCIRIGTSGLMPSIVPPVLYGVSAEATYQTTSGTSDDAYITLDLSPTSGPGIAAINAAWSWDDLAATGLTWEQAASAFSSWWGLAKGDV